MKKTINLGGVFLFIIWPFGSFILAVKNFSNKGLRIIIPLFLGFIGYTINPRDESDVQRTKEYFETLSGVSFDNIFNTYLAQLSGKSSGGTEIFVTFLSFFTHLFTDNWRIMLGLWGFFLGYIMIMFFDKIYQEYLLYPRNISTKLFFFFSISFLMPVYSINGRFWLAYWVYIYIVWLYISTREKKYIFYAFLPVLIHQGIILACFILVLYELTYRLQFRYAIYYTLIVISFIYASSGIGVELLRNVGTRLGGEYETKIGEYTGSFYDTVNHSGAGNGIGLGQAGWFLRLNVPLLNYSMLLALLLVRIKHNIRFDKKAEHLYLFILLFIAVQNFIGNIPSMGGRYQTIMLGLVVLLFLLLSTKNRLTLNQPEILIAMFALSFNFIVNLRLDIGQLYGYIFFSNPILAAFGIQDITLWELIK